VSPNYWPLGTLALVAGSRPTSRTADPAGALQLAKQAGISPAEFLYLGDSDIDMKTAVGAGCIYWSRLGFPFRTELLGAGAKAVINNRKNCWSICKIGVSYQRSAFRFEL